jgi:HAD superfamily hydrolase (TIGR01509 family)
VPAREPIEAVVFDMDGVLVDTEHLWDEVREALTEEWGGRYTPEAQEAMMGMSSPEWSRYLHEVVGLREPPEVINAEVVRRMLERYEMDLPVVPGAVEAVRRLAREGYRLAVASSSPMRLIRAVLSIGGLDDRFEVVLSAEDEERGKPDPAVYLSAARELGIPPERCLAVEDSINGVRSAKDAGMVCVAVPVSGVTDGFEGADLVLGSIEEFDDRIWAGTGTVPAATASER